MLGANACRGDSGLKRQQQRRELEGALDAAQESLAELQAEAAAVRGAEEAAEGRLSELQQEYQRLVALLTECGLRKVSAREVLTCFLVSMQNACFV